eukprot:1184927-Prorocentrum_minimum.AAC.3
MDVKGSAVDVKGSAVDVEGLAYSLRLWRSLLGVRGNSGGGPSCPVAKGVTKRGVTKRARRDLRDVSCRFA